MVKLAKKRNSITTLPCMVECSFFPRNLFTEALELTGATVKVKGPKARLSNSAAVLDL